MQQTTYWLLPVIIIAGILQAWGPPMNGALPKSLVNPNIIDHGNRHNLAQ